MLISLSIRNYAIIDALNVNFGEGLNIITGETGAGKSILVGALSLILGQRADTKVLRSAESKCIVEAQFDVTRYRLHDFFDKYDLDYDSTSTIRREITPAGKSRAFINDTPVNLSQLKELTTRLVDIHSQHETMLLSDGTFQLQLLDAFAQQSAEARGYTQLFRQYSRKLQELAGLKEQEDRARLDADYHQFQFNELEEANLQVEEQLRLEERLASLENVEAIDQAVQEAVQTLQDEGGNVLDQLRRVGTALRGVAEFSKSIDQLAERIDSTQIELEDVVRELENQDAGDKNPEQVLVVRERLDMIYQLQQKHRVQSIQELIELKEQLQQKLDASLSLDESIVALQEELTQLQEELTTKAALLSEKRAACIPGMQGEVNTLLSKLGMPFAEFTVHHQQLESPGSNGLDAIQWLFSANKGSAPQQFDKVASGGELSRLMLSLRSILSKVANFPTIILDEIDTGVSGDIADKVGEVMREMAASMQVISITHLPQIAGKGHQHFMVSKVTDAERTTSRMHLLTDKERIDEIAKMLSGKETTEAAVENAKELLRT